MHCLYLTRQGIAIRGHTEEERNLYQLLRVWSNDNKDIECYLKANKYTSQ